MAEVLEGLKVDTTAMRTNLQRSRGLVYSEAVSIRLSHALGKSAAHSLVEKLSAAAMNEGKTLLEVLRADAEVVSAIPANELSDLFDPERGFGAAPEVIERVLVRWRQVRATSFGTAP
jgi:3-carboxy-cis,cis-muconate cycloisomerase